MQVGYSREYLQKLVDAEQKRQLDAAGIQYEYNTEVNPCASLIACHRRHAQHPMPTARL